MGLSAGAYWGCHLDARSQRIIQLVQVTQQVQDSIFTRKERFPLLVCAQTPTGTTTPPQRNKNQTKAKSFQTPASDGPPLLPRPRTPQLYAAAPARSHAVSRSHALCRSGRRSPLRRGRGWPLIRGIPPASPRM